MAFARKGVTLEAYVKKMSQTKGLTLHTFLHMWPVNLNVYGGRLNMKVQ